MLPYASTSLSRTHTKCSEHTQTQAEQVGCLAQRNLGPKYGHGRVPCQSSMVIFNPGSLNVVLLVISLIIVHREAWKSRD